jgi:hypothetical protein
MKISVYCLLLFLIRCTTGLAQDKSLYQSTTLILQPNFYSPLTVTPLAGRFVPESYSAIGLQIGLAQNFWLNNFRITLEASVGTAPYRTDFFIPAGEVAAVDYLERNYSSTDYFMRYSQVCLILGYSKTITPKQKITGFTGIGYRRNPDAISIGRATYKPNINSPRVIVYELTTFTDQQKLNSFTIPLGISAVYSLSERIEFNYGIRFTYSPANWFSGVYDFFPNLPEHSYGEVKMQNWYAGIDLGFSWRKKK